MFHKKHDFGLIVSFLSLVFIMFCLVFSFTVAQANNHADTRFTRYTEIYNATMITPSRAKYDVSSMYTFNDRSSSSYRAMGVGRYNAGQDENDYRYDSGTIIDRVICTRGYSYYIRNNVYEHGYDFASLLIYPLCGTCTVSMLWSPDSV